MPIPQAAFTNSVQPTGDTQARLQPADFASGGQIMGKALQGFGQDGTQAASNVQDIHVHDATVAATNADNLRTQLRQDFYYAPQTGFFNLKGQAALEAGQNLGQNLKAIDDKAGALLTNNSLAQKMYNKQTTMRNIDEAPLINKHLETSRIAVADKVDADTYDTNKDQFINHAGATDPASQTILNNSLQAAKDVAARQYARTGMNDPVGLELAQRKAVDDFVKSGVDRIAASKDAQAAVEFVRNYAGQGTEEAASALMKTLGPGAAKVRAPDMAATHAIYTDGSRAATGAEVAPASNEGAGAAGETDAQGQTVNPFGTAATPAPAPAGGKPVPSASSFSPAALHAAFATVESHNHQFKSDGQTLVKSYAGAEGVMQLMPQTMRDPGHGIPPAADHSEAENRRVGNALIDALVKKYNGNLTVAATAYNYGEGNTDKFLASHPNPLKGEISDAAWANSLPLDAKGTTEHRDYSGKVFAALGSSNSSTQTASGMEPVTGQKAMDLYNSHGKFIDIPASILAVRNDPNMSQYDKEATIDELTSHMAQARQADAEGKRVMLEGADRWMGQNLPGGRITDVSQLPISMQTQMQRDAPAEWLALQHTAAANKAQDEQGQKTDQQQKTHDDVRDLMWDHPQQFVYGTNLRTQFPTLSHEDMESFEGQQHTMQTQMEKPTQQPKVDYKAIRSTAYQYIGSGDANAAITDKKDPRINDALQNIALAEQNMATEQKKPITQTQRDGLVREALSKIYITNKNGDGWFSTNTSTAPYYQRDRLAAQPGFQGSTTNTKSWISNAFRRVLGTIPDNDDIAALQGAGLTSSNIDAKLLQYKQQKEAARLKSIRGY